MTRWSGWSRHSLGQEDQVPPASQKWKKLKIGKWENQFHISLSSWCAPGPALSVGDAEGDKAQFLSLWGVEVGAHSNTHTTCKVGCSKCVERTLTQGRESVLVVFPQKWTLKPRFKCKYSWHLNNTGVRGTGPCAVENPCNFWLPQNLATYSPVLTVSLTDDINSQLPHILYILCIVYCVLTKKLARRKKTKHC